MNTNKMFGMKNKAGGVSTQSKGGSRNVGGGSEAAGLELRPGGMLVQKRNSDSNQNSISVPTIKVRVKYGSSYHEVNISSQASFGDLKKMLAEQTGLHHQDQKILYKDKERDSKSFIDYVGVKNGSKLVLLEDEISKERRCIESRKNSRMEKASKDIAAIRMEVDKFAKQVASVEMDINGGKKVMETTILSLTEHLMNQLIKLDGISADGDVKLQRKMQVTRVQKYIETLDTLKIKNSMMGSNRANTKFPTRHQHPQVFTCEMKIYNNQDKPDKRDWPGTNARPAMISTKWETF
ncbi:chaperone [Lithospermum erythrorhizon]|uniref:Chaperone n=1 Tax=Lithospermum erythrorhizon TaxID=34254 RepID=A0AAV3QNH8_LITER